MTTVKNNIMGRCVWMVLAIFGLAALVLSQKPDVEFTINEELAVSTRVGNLQEVENVFPDLSKEERKSLQYGILDQGDVSSSLFNITRQGGLISVARRIDRESICFTVENCIMKVNILASAQNSSQFDSRVITVHFKIVDINDNSPTFEKSSLVLEVPEGRPQDTVLKIHGANDRDFTAEYKVKNYTLQASQDIFSLSAHQSLDGSSEIHLRLKKTLDREIQDTYELTITAFDGGPTPRSSTLLITVTVTDQNDNEPQFLSSNYSVTIDSRTLPNHVVLQVSATDVDEGDNALLTYDFTKFQKPVMEKVFLINSTTGEISVAGPLRPGKYEFIVEAQDSGSPRLKTQTVVTINVNNTGNSPPKISIATLGNTFDQNVVSVLEPGGRGLFVAFVVVDDDSADDVVCHIKSDVFMLVPVANKGYKIVLQSSVDREKVAFYNLNVTCEETGDQPLNNTISVRVNVEDANDNAPVCGQQRYSRTMSEGKKNGEYVLQVSASDADIGLNGAVRYSLQSNYTQYFHIDQLTGVLTAVGDLDREAHPTITFNITATDQGNQPKQSWAEVVITLEDINDNIPEFQKKVMVFQVQEDVEENKVIAHLVANDPDVGINSQLQYVFTGSLDGSDRAFTVLTNGSVVVTTKLDREKKSNYTFSVMVKDNGTPSLMSRASVVIEVLDVNDNAPAILFPKSQNYTVLISSVPEKGVILSRIIAYDDDADDNGVLKFTLVSGNDDAAFEISETMGEIKVAQGSRLKNNKKYDIGVLVSDRGLPPKFTTANIKIDVSFNNITQELARQDKESKDDYIIIVAVIAAVTVVFSTLIIVAICILFQKDKNKETKHGPEHVLTHIGIHGNVNSSEKVTPILSETKRGPNQTPYNFRNVSSSSMQEKGVISSDLICVQVKDDGSDLPKGKSVSFTVSKSDMVSPESHYIIARNDLQQSLSECGDSSMMCSSDENASLRGSSLPEEVRGVSVRSYHSSFFRIRKL
ncbi:unnamed protein product [Candidula unifasciata]|uniref:Cadherin domain-containing protein n=1 Tax=Candidula unifasciata TaxID=100452 RepID=A0A8S3ZSM4_9EUPU|nr:unnamed protein product [Candidula unifasciata]